MFFIKKNTKISLKGMAVMDINDFLKKAISLDASDVHLHVGEPPLIRKNGMIMKTSLPALTTENMKNIYEKIAPDKFKADFSKLTDLDFVYEIPNIARFRVNFSLQSSQPSFVFRIIPIKVRTLEELEFPELIHQILKVKSGLVFVTGPTGCGKSTTVASILDWYNRTFQKHILTIESPIEYVIKSHKSLISQRQIGIDTPSFYEGMKYAIHQDPDVIFLGEMDDRETAKLALKAANMGYLVISTLHTPDAVQTIINIINMFEKNDRENVMHELAENLKGTISQKLVYSEKLKTRFAATEVILATPTFQDCIRKGEIEEIYQLMHSNNPTIVSLNDSLLKLTLDDKISKEDALAYSNLPDELSRSFRREFYAKKMEIEKQKEAERIAEEQRRHAEEEEKKAAEEAAKKAEEERKAAEAKARQEELKKQEEEKLKVEQQAQQVQNDGFAPYSSDNFASQGGFETQGGFEPQGGYGNSSNFGGNFAPQNGGFEPQGENFGNNPNGGGFEPMGY